jgi:hypothetical protein
MKPLKEVYDWIRDHRLYHLCIDDLETLKPGDVLDVVIFDRNFEEYGMWDEIPANTPFEPKQFFRFNHHQIEWLGDGRWNLKLQWGDFEHPLHYNVESLATNWTWLGPDENGMIDVRQEIINGDEEIPLTRKAFSLSITDFHPRTRVGWRGPVMMWKHVQESKDRVFWLDEQTNFSSCTD